MAILYSPFPFLPLALPSYFLSSGSILLFFLPKAIDYAEKVGRQGKAAYLYIPDGHFKSKHFKVPHNTLVIGSYMGAGVSMF